MSQRVFTVSEVKNWFESSGTPVSSWADENGFPRDVVYALLSGRVRGRRGIAHRAALALRLKAPPTEEIALGHELATPGGIQ